MERLHDNHVKSAKRWKGSTFTSKLPTYLSTDIKGGEKLAKLVCEKGKGYYANEPEKWLCVPMITKDCVKTAATKFMKKAAAGFWTKFKAFMSGLGEAITCLWGVDAVKAAVVKSAARAGLNGVISTLAALTPVGWILKAIKLMIAAYDIYSAIKEA